MENVCLFNIQLYVYLCRYWGKYLCWQRQFTMTHTLNSSLKYGLQTDKMSLWAWTYWPPAANVTSTRSSPSSNAWNDWDKFEWKSFHRSENCSGIAMAAWKTSPSNQNWRRPYSATNCTHNFQSHYASAQWNWALTENQSRI